MKALIFDISQVGTLRQGRKEGGEGVSTRLRKEINFHLAGMKNNLWKGFCLKVSQSKWKIEARSLQKKGEIKLKDAGQTAKSNKKGKV